MTKLEIFPAAVDGSITSAEIDTPLLLTPGQHVIRILVEYSNVGGSAVATIDLQAGKTYAMTGEYDNTIWAHVWFKDKATGEIVGNKIDVPMGRGAISPVFIPLVK